MPKALDRRKPFFYKAGRFCGGIALGAQVAQLVEQRTENPRVGGSIPPLATIIQNVYSGYMGDELEASGSSPCLSKRLIPRGLINRGSLLRRALATLRNQRLDQE